MPRHYVVKEGVGYATELCNYNYDDGYGAQYGENPAMGLQASSMFHAAVSGSVRQVQA